MVISKGITGVILEKLGVCILFTLHLFISVFSFILDLLIVAVTNLQRNFRTRHSLVEECKNNVKCFPKLPKHLVIIIEDDEISYFDCIKLLLWCICLEIPFVSFYSFSNAINPTSLYEVLCKENKTSLQNIKWGKTFHKSVTEMAKKDINGYIWAPVTEVNLFSAKTVQESNENVMLRLCHNNIRPESITIEKLDQTFKEEVPLPDPCLALIFGKTFSTYGFLPWQLRLTELVHMKTHHNLQDEDFLRALRRFACCEQRFGK